MFGNKYLEDLLEEDVQVLFEDDDDNDSDSDSDNDSSFDDDDEDESETLDIDFKDKLKIKLIKTNLDKLETVLEYLIDVYNSEEIVQLYSKINILKELLKTFIQNYNEFSEKEQRVIFKKFYIAIKSISKKISNNI